MRCAGLSALRTERDSHPVHFCSILRSSGADSRWENGTEAQAVLEWKYPQLSVFSTSPLPLPDDLTADAIPEIITLAQDTLNNRPANFSNPALPHRPSSSASGSAAASATPVVFSFLGDNQRRQAQGGTPTSAPVANGATTSTPTTSNTLNVPLVTAPALPSGQPLLEDGAAGDPPSLGIAVLIADKATGGGRLVKNVGFTSAAQSQVDYLLYGVPRVSLSVFQCGAPVSQPASAMAVRKERQFLAWCLTAKPPSLTSPHFPCPHSVLPPLLRLASASNKHACSIYFQRMHRD